MPDPRQAVGIVQNCGYMARLGHILKAVLEANWHLSSKAAWWEASVRPPFIDNGSSSLGEG